MTSVLPLVLQPGDWLNLLTYYLSISLLAVGGAITAAPDMHRFLVTQNAWLTDAQFNASIAIAQAAPGPNVLFVALMGWHVGLNAGGPQPWASAALGLVLCMGGLLLPSTLLTWGVTRWAHQHRQRRGVRAFKQGLGPVVIGLMLATAWLLARPQAAWATTWPLWALSLATLLLMWRTRLHLLWLLAAGALLGALGWV